MLLLWFVLDRAFSFQSKVTDVVKLGLSLLQDLWIPYFTITTDITASAMRVHTDGECVGSLLQQQVINNGVELHHFSLFLEFSLPLNLSSPLFLPSLLFAEH